MVSKCIILIFCRKAVSTWRTFWKLGKRASEPQCIKKGQQHSPSLVWSSKKKVYSLLEDAFQINSTSKADTLLTSFPNFVFSPFLQLAKAASFLWKLAAVWPSNRINLERVERMVAAPRLAFNKRQVKAIVFVQSLNLRHVRVRQTRPVAPKSEIFTNVLGSPHPGHDSNFPLDLKESRFCMYSEIDLLLLANVLPATWEWFGRQIFRVFCWVQAEWDFVAVEFGRHLASSKFDLDIPRDCRPLLGCRGRDKKLLGGLGSDRDDIQFGSRWALPGWRSSGKKWVVRSVD